jgi:ribosome-binding factor A
MTMDDILDDKKAGVYKSFFECKICDYNTSDNSKYNRHILTEKHKRMTHELHLGEKKAEKADNDKKFTCVCGSNYRYRQGLWKHQQKCNSSDNTSEKIDDTKMILCDKELIMTLVKQNAELLEIIKNGTNHINTNSHNNHSHNKTFNLQFFLNETCKDAMNISEFIENISLQLSDLESIGKLGYVEGVSNIIIKNLNALEVTQRPLHCTDKKREIVYVKDEDEWQKEQDDKKHIRQVISNVVSKNMKLLPEYQNKYPECMNPESRKSDEYNKIIMETMGGGMDVVDKNKEKIIRKVTKEVIVEKDE